MTASNHPTDFMDNPAGRDYSYRFKADNDEAWKLLRRAKLKGRYIDMYPASMKHLRTRIDHVVLETHDKMGYIKGMKKFAVSPDWKRVPNTQGKMEVNNANGGGSRVKMNGYYVGGEWGHIDLQFRVEFTPTEIIDAFDAGINENEIREGIMEERRCAIRERIDALENEKYEYQQQCSHSHVIDVQDGRLSGYCEDCHREWWHDDEMQCEIEASGGAVVGVA